MGIEVSVQMMEAAKQLAAEMREHGQVQQELADFPGFFVIFGEAGDGMVVLTKVGNGQEFYICQQK